MTDDATEKRLAGLDRRFWKWWDKMQEAGRTSPAGKVLVAAGFTIAHTGGGCLAWERTAATAYVWICHGNETLGDEVENPEAEIWAVGVYSADGDRFSMAQDVSGLSTAIALAERMLCYPDAYYWEPPPEPPRAA
jgi:hypothetical protein